MGWNEEISTASFDDIEFEVQSIDDSIARRIAIYKYPWRNGADLDDMGREPRPTSMTAIFMGENATTNLNKFLQKIDEGKTYLFVHPLLGQWDAKIIRGDVHMDYSQRDLYTVQIQVVEDGTSADLPEVYSIQSLLSEVEAWIDEVETYVDNATAISDLVDEARNFVATVQDAAEFVANKANKIRKKVETALAYYEDLSRIENYAAVKAIKRLNYSCKKAADRMQRDKPKVIRDQIKSSVPLPVLAHEYYGDADRAEELRINNKIRNPFKTPKWLNIKRYAE